jgi:hypothetical protein
MFRGVAGSKELMTLLFAIFRLLVFDKHTEDVILWKA